MSAVHSIVLRTGMSSVAIPDSAEIVGVAFDPAYRSPAIYYMHRGELPAVPFNKRTFLVVATYEVFESKFEVVYLGSCVDPQSETTLHILEVING